MVEMSALNHLMSTHILQQAQQIELLYDQAVEATKMWSWVIKSFLRPYNGTAAAGPFSCYFCLYLLFLSSSLIGTADIDQGSKNEEDTA
ncbi:hypothetical protein Nepgr_006069 [Nepenthes gracilis]|uniref:Uncharacterized protein n=1 Tax=Nepenthes gracilis TaxID=150966 RepID=A0AAD3XH21_NEPGR|nr:hypothetical protein Nepgr_006069 [Nepenthes gracilis]